MFQTDQMMPPLAIFTASHQGLVASAAAHHSGPLLRAQRAPAWIPLRMVDQSRSKMVQVFNMLFNMENHVDVPKCQAVEPLMYQNIFRNMRIGSATALWQLQVVPDF